MKKARPALAEGLAIPSGLEFPADRLYHRGHTWVHQENDGTLTIGLDDLARRVVGAPDAVNLPQPGEAIEKNGTAWSVERFGTKTRILSPVDGEVVAAGGPGQPFYLKVKPAGQFDDRHLLRGAEVGPWIASEIDRLQAAFTVSQVGPTMADGGTFTEDLPSASPETDWDAVWGEVFLHP